MVKWLGEIAAWLAAGLATIIAWAVRTSVFNRLTSIEMQINHLERLTTSSVTQVDLAKSIDALREEIYKTRLEIKQDVAQIVHLLKGS